MILAAASGSISVLGQAVSAWTVIVFLAGLVLGMIVHGKWGK
jgi:hypothetical protein